MKNIVFAALIGLTIWSCAKKNELDRIADVGRDTLVYRTSIGGNSWVKEIRCGGVVTQQNIIIHVSIFNSGHKSVLLQPHQWQLVCNQMRSAPVKISSEAQALLPGDDVLVSLVFEPVHDRKLFQETGLRGNIATTYDLEIKIKDVSQTEITETIRLTADPRSYRLSVAKFGLESNTTAYILSGGDKFMLAQQEYSNRTMKFRTEHSVNVSGNEILVDGLWLKVHARHRFDTLNVVVRIVNQSSYTVSLASPNLISRGDAFQMFNSDSPQPIKILNGGRASTHYKIRIPRMDEFGLELSPSITSQGRNYLFLNGCVWFKKAGFNSLSDELTSALE